MTPQKTSSDASHSLVPTPGRTSYVRLAFRGLNVFALLVGLLIYLTAPNIALLKNNLKLIWRPEEYHGAKVRGPFFEGYYYKNVLPNNAGSVIFIPGTFIPAKAEGFYRNETDLRRTPHAFVMVLRDPDAVECLYYAYPLEEFEAKPGVKDGLGFSVRVGRSVFTADGMNVDLGADNLVWTSDDDYTRFVDKSLRERYERHPPAKDAAASGLPRRLLKEEMERKHLSVRGAVGFKNVVRFPRSWIFPSIMGPFHYLPFLQCYHGVVSFYHRTTGSIEFFSDDSVERAYDLEGGHGYIEKDHGLEFPINWIWLQSASFKEESGSSLLVSVADVPLISRDGLLARAISLFPFGPAVVGRFHFSGFLVALHHARTNTTHNLSLYTGSKIGALSFETLDDEEERLEIKFRDYSGNTEMTVSTRRPHGRGVPLPGPLLDSDKMALIVEESISVEINVKLERDGKIIFEDTGLIGGMEVVGDMASLLEGIWGLDTSPREDL